ncbi:MAG: hypothetical protein QNJ54_05065 [Prochloraceae cyanobacterium]|nr:hypothetical protein [Prochloraceae cyanobacterium]
MSFFNFTRPILCRKQEYLDYQDLEGLLQVNLKIRDKTLFSGFYTRIDQVFVLWGLICAAIFITAQFAPINWNTQAIFWSVLTGVGTLLMTVMTYFWVSVERLRWMLYSWVILMLAGTVITDLGIFLGWGLVLMNLCHIWLGLCGIGYLCTAVGLRSRAFIIPSVIHLFGIILLPYCGSWQFLTTGLLMTVHLLLFAETQWDMRPPIENFSLLTEEQKHFNRQQQKLRQAS